MIFFYQGAYVLCRLFKKTELKQDEIGESSIINEAEEIITSPAEVRFSAEDELSESLSPSLCGTAELQPSSVESHQTLGSEKAAAVTPITFDWQSLSCIADEMEDNVLDTKSIPVSHIISYSIFCQFFFFCILCTFIYLYSSLLLFSLILSWRSYWRNFVPMRNRQQIIKCFPHCILRCSQSLEIHTCITALLVISTIINKLSRSNMELMLLMILRIS